MSAANRLRTTDDPAGLRCTPDPGFPVPVLRLVGELDLVGTNALRRALQKALADEPAGVVLDVAELTVVDRVELTMFSVLARTAAQWPGCPVVLCAPAPSLAAALERMSITRTVPVYPTAEQAVAALRPAAPGDGYRRRLAGVPASAAHARALLAEACARWRLGELLPGAQVVLTELVANAVEHADGDLTVVVRRTANFLHLAVRDGSRAVPVRETPDAATAESGRGLLLVEAIASAWGSLPTSDGKVVWATLRRAA